MAGRSVLTELVAEATRLAAGGLAARASGWDPPGRGPRSPRRSGRLAIGMVGLAAGGSALLTWAMLRFDAAGALSHLLADPLRAVVGPLAPGVIAGSVWGAWLAVLLCLLWALRRRLRRSR